MFKFYRKTKIITLLVLPSLLLWLFSASIAFAKYDLNLPRGIYTQSFSTPYKNVDEVCVMPKHMAGVKYRKKDRKNEAMLCSLDFYGKTQLNGTQLEYTAVCPKSHSTNPAVEVYRIRKEGLELEDYESKQCRLPSKKRDKSQAKRLAKFKQSISCSYTPSILAYYHVSRMLGDIANVNPTVIRTMALKEHKKIAKLGYRVATRHKQRIQALTWKMFIETEKNIDNRKNRYGRRYSSTVFTTDNKQIFGAMQKDVKKEGLYKAFYIKRHKNGYRRINSQPFVKQLLSRSSQATQSVEKLFQLKDYSDMLVLDYLLSQEDRFANVAYKDYYYEVDDEKKIERSRVPEEKENQYSEAQLAQGNIYKVRRLILKDNDCGVNRSNHTKKSRIMSKIRHMNLQTYQRLLWLDSQIEMSETEDFFRQELLFTKRDWKKFEGLVQSLKRTLQKNCRSGRLLLDLNPERKIKSLPEIKAKQRCELPSWGDLMFQ